MAKNLTPTLDLHGMQVDDATMAVDRFLTKSQSQGTKKIRIMTGKGTGAVRKAVTDYLKKGGFQFEFERQANGTRNEGVLSVFLDD